MDTCSPRTRPHTNLHRIVFDCPRLRTHTYYNGTRKSISDPFTSYTATATTYIIIMITVAIIILLAAETRRNTDEWAYRVRVGIPPVYVRVYRITTSAYIIHT